MKMKKSSSITDYFLVSGIDNVNAPRLSEFDTSFCYKRAISEIVIFDKSNETIKDGYTLVDKTISGYDANLSNEMFGSRKIYLAYKNEPTHEPIIDMGIYTENSTPPGDDVKIIYTTPKRYAANIIDNDRKRSYITYKKKSYSSEYDLSQHEKPFQFSSKSCYSDSSNFHVITDIVIILPDKGEQLPQTYTMINRNIKNSLFQPKMFICYRRTVGKSNLLSFTPDILIKFPQNNFDSIPYGVSRFIHPMGVCVKVMKKRDIPVIEINQTNKKLYKVSKEFYWRNILYSSFVLTTTNGNYLYGYTLQILEEYDFIRLLPRHYAGLLTDFLSESAKNCISFQTKNLTVLSKNDNCYEFFHEWLLELYRIYLHSLDTPNMNLEIYLAHLLVNVEMPSAKKPKVAVSFNSDSIQCFLRQLSSNQLDIKVDCVISLLCCLSPKTIVHVLKCLMSEQQVMLHSVYTNLVVCVVHGLKTILFPFIWMCPYIPLCPLHIGEIMNSPTPLLVGIDSRYFDMYDLPDSICCVDIGSNNVLCERYSIKNQNDSFSFPKKATKCLIDRLAALRYELLAKIFTPTDFETWPRNIIKSICLNRKKLEAYAVRIQETFLCFMCTIYQGYNKFCHTLSRMPPNDYDIFASAFLKNDFIASNSSLSDFYRKITQTHMFQKFIIDRTVSSYDIDNCNANFFDEYSESLFIYSSKYIYGMNPPEIYYRQHFNQNSSNTAYCEMPSFKLSIINEKLIEWSKVQTVELDFVKSKIFDISLNAFNEHVDCLMNNNDKLNYSQLNHDSPKKYLRRNKNERINNLKNFQNIISLPKDSAHLMKCVIMNVWILCLPAYMGRIHKNYRFSFMKHVLFRLEKYLVKHKKFMDEIVFRTLIQLCGEYYEDTRLVKTILELMKQYDIKTNMITVASFNSVISDSNNRAYDKYLFHSEKPTVDPIDSKWILLSNAFKAVVLFKRLVPCKNDFQKSNIFKQKSQKSYPYSVTLNSVKIKKEKDTCLVPLVKKKSHVFSMGNPLSFSLKMRRIKSDSDVFKKNESNWINLKMNQFSVTDDIQLRLNLTMQPEQSEIADIINNGENNCFSVANSDILKDISFTHKTDDAISLLYYKRHENIKLNHKYVEDGTKYLKYVFSKMEPSIIKKRHFSERFKCFVSIYSKSDLHYIGSKLNRNDVSSILKNKMNDTQSKIKITFKDYYSWFKSKKLFNDKEKVLADNLNDYASAKNQLVIQNESSSLNTITRVSERFQKLKKIIYDAYESTLISSDDSDNEKDVNDNSYYKVKTHSLQTKRYISKAKSLDILLDNKTNYTNFFTSHFNNIDDQFKFPEYYERLKNSVSNESIQLTSTKSRRLVRYASVPISLDDYWSTLKYKSKTNSNGKIYTCSDNTKLNFSESLFKPQENEQPLVNIEIHSTSACQNCKNLMYDEEIMDGWIIDDSNHSINCKICNKHFVPQLSIKLSISHRENYNCALYGKFEHTEKFNIAYLNPFVLQKQMENLFDDHKFDCIIDYNFSQNHSILFWNLIWYFNKTNFPNHLPNAILRSSFIIQNFVKNYKGSTKETENDFLINIDVYLDHFNEFNQLKLYHYHKYDKIINSNIFENFFLSKKHIVFIMWHIERNVLIQPILLLMKKRLILSQNKILASSVSIFSIYHELKFLVTFVYGTNANLANFDKMYRESFKFIRQETRKNRKKFKKNVPYDYIGKFHVSDLPPTKSCSCMKETFSLLFRK